MQIAHRLKTIFTLDATSLAVFRIGLGLLLALDLIHKASGLVEFYSDLGVYPRKLAIDQLGWWSFSIHMMSGQARVQAALFVLAGFFALAVILGYRTRLFIFLSWIFLLSLQARNPLVLHSGDALLRLLLFWSFFLPMNQRLSIDAIHHPELARRSSQILSVGSLALICQMSFMYLFTALLKDHKIWRVDYTAVYYALKLDQFATPLGSQLLEYPELLKFLTMGTWWLEMLGPLLLLIPFGNSMIRILIPVSFIGLHLGLASTMYLALFPWTCMIGWVALLPAQFWQSARIPSLLIGRMNSSLIKLAPYLPRIEPSPLASWPHWMSLRELFALICLLAITYWNVYTMPTFGKRVPQPIRSFALPMRLDQYWTMFAPFPMRNDGWFVMDGRLKDDTNIDVWNFGTPVSFEKPQDVYANHRDNLWRKYMTNVWVIGENKDVKLSFGKYLCRSWNRLSGPRQPEDLLESYEFYFVRERTEDPGSPAIEPEKILKWRHNCLGQLADEDKSRTEPKKIQD